MNSHKSSDPKVLYLHITMLHYRRVPYNSFSGRHFLYGGVTISHYFHLSKGLLYTSESGITIIYTTWATRYQSQNWQVVSSRHCRTFLLMFRNFCNVKTASENTVWRKIIIYFRMCCVSAAFAIQPLMTGLFPIGASSIGYLRSTLCNKTQDRSWAWFKLTLIENETYSLLQM